jgi:hypothetical protein
LFAMFLVGKFFIESALKICHWNVKAKF